MPTRPLRYPTPRWNKTRYEESSTRPRRPCPRVGKSRYPPLRGPSLRCAPTPRSFLPHDREHPQNPPTEGWSRRTEGPSRERPSVDVPPPSRRKRKCVEKTNLRLHLTLYTATTLA